VRDAVVRRVMAHEGALLQKQAKHEGRPDRPHLGLRRQHEEDCPEHCGAHEGSPTVSGSPLADKRLARGGGGEGGLVQRLKSQRAIVR